MDEEHYLLQLVQQCCHPDAAQVVALDTPISELRIDSLKMIQIVFELETRFDIEMEEHRLFQVESLADLLTLVQEARPAQPADA